MSLCHKYSGAPLKEIATRFDIGVTAKDEASKRVHKKMAEDSTLQQLIGDVSAKINKWKMES